jgi:hypothetical protein
MKLTQSTLPLAFLSTLALTAVSFSTADASISVTLPTPSLAGSIHILEDITFTVTTAGNLTTIVLDEWVVSDLSLTAIGGAAISPDFSYSLNAGSTATVPFSPTYALSDNYSYNTGDISPNDGLIVFENIIASVNDIFTVKAGTYILEAGSLPENFNPQAQQTFSGSVFLASDVGVRMSDDTPSVVPEPNAVVIALLAGVSFLRRRRMA